MNVTIVEFTDGAPSQEMRGYTSANASEGVITWVWEETREVLIIPLHRIKSVSGSTEE